MGKALLELIAVLLGPLKTYFSKESEQNRRIKKAEKEQRRKNEKIDRAIAGETDINVVTHDLLGDHALDVELPGKEGSGD